MLISYRWLRRHVDLDGLSPAAVAEALTIHTAEVEGLERFAPALSDVVVGHVVERAKHPDADKLSVCRVDLGAAGEGTPLQIVCGAPNVAAGQRVAVARTGTVLPGGLKLKKTKIRGEESNGMICSERELALGEEHAGIWVLPADAAVGRPVADALDLEDWVIEIDNKSLTHRPDLWGHRGLAREIAAISERPLRPLDLRAPETGAGTPYPVRVESDGCSRYIGLPIDGVVNGRSPEWLRFLLLAAGQRPLDLLVDVSNFVMLDLGQPNHLFDRRRLSPEGIVVRDARPGERMRTLDEIERRLAPTDMLICAGDEPVALAGVMGGEESKVAPDTTELLLEVASFDATRVRRTAARLGLRTDASARFEKSLDPTLPAKAAAHLVDVLRAIQPGLRLPAPAGDAGEWRDPATTVRLRPARARAVLGKDVSDDEMEGTLSRLGFGVTRGEPWSVAVPSERATKDVGIEEDLIEEIGRMHGYGRIAERPLFGELVPPPRDERRGLVRLLADRLAGAACFHEAMTHSFQSDELIARLRLEGEPWVRVVNPLVEGAARIRRSVAPSLLGLLAANRRQRSDVRLFEIGKGYLPERANERGEPREVHELGLVWALARGTAATRWDETALARLRGVLAHLLAAAGVEAPRWERGAADGAPAWMHPGKWLRADWADGDERAIAVGELEPGVARALELAGELESDVAVARVSIDALLAAPRRRARYRPIPRFPSVKVDVALAADDALAAGELEAAIVRAGKSLVERVELFDVYRGESLGAGKKSLAYHVVLAAADRTLSDADAARFLARLERECAALGAELRKD